MIAPLLACGGAAVIAALRITGHPAGPFAASLVEGVLPVGTAVALAGWLLRRPLRLLHGSREMQGGR